MTTPISSFLKSYPTAGDGGGGGSSVIVLKNLGTWDAEANLTSDGKQLVSGQGEEGGFYVVSKAGTTTLDGVTDWEVQQMALFIGARWIKYDLTKIYNFDLPLKLEAGHVSLQTEPVFNLSTQNKLDMPFGSALKLYANLPISPTVTMPHAVDLGWYGTSTFNATNFKTMGRPAFLAINNGNLEPDQRVSEGGRYGCLLFPYQAGATPYIAMLMLNVETGSMFIKWTASDYTWGVNRYLQFYNTSQTGLLGNLQTTVRTTLVDSINSLVTTYDAPLLLTTGATKRLSLSIDNTLTVANSKLQIPLSNSLKIYVDSPQPSSNKTCLDLNYYSDYQWVADNFKLLERPCFLGVYNQYLPEDQRLPENGKYGAVMLPYQVGSVHQIAMILVNTDTANVYIKWTHGDAIWGVNQYVQIYNTNQTGKLSDLVTTVKTTLVAALNSVKTEAGNLSDLTTTVKTNLVAAINSLVTQITEIAGRIPESYALPLSIDNKILSLLTDNSLNLTTPDGKLKVATSYRAPFYFNPDTQELSLNTDDSLAVVDDKLSVVNATNVKYVPPLFIDNDENVFLQTNNSLHVTATDELEVPLSKSLKVYTDLPQPGGPNKTCIDFDYYSDAAWVADNFKNMRRPSFLAVFNNFMPDDQKLPEWGKYGAVMLPYQTAGDNHIAMILVNTETGNMYIKWTAGNDNWGPNNWVQIYNTKQTGKLEDLQTDDKSSLVGAINNLKNTLGNDVKTVAGQWTGTINPAQNTSVSYVRMGRVATLTIGSLGGGEYDRSYIINRNSPLIFNKLLPYSVMPLFNSPVIKLCCPVRASVEFEGTQAGLYEVPLLCELYPQDKGSGVGVEIAIRQQGESEQPWHDNTHKFGFYSFSISYIVDATADDVSEGKLLATED